VSDEDARQAGAAHAESGAGPEAHRRPLSVPAPAGQREQFDRFELATVLSRYDTGEIVSIAEFPRGSRRSPKVVLRCEHGVYLLKRRQTGRDDPDRVRFTHALILDLVREGFPTARLIGTRHDRSSLVEQGGRMYELFEFIPGSAFDSSEAATEAGGRELGALHELLARYVPPGAPPGGGYHGLARLPERLRALGERFEDGGGAASAAGELAHAYQSSLEAVNAEGLDRPPRQVVHGDWHPGNLIFRGQRVAGAVDFDSARMATRLEDFANGALQFSVTRSVGDPARWPESLDEARFRAFCRGYHGVFESRTEAESRILPHLMVEALIVEAAAPIAATGSFERFEGGAFLVMIARKVRWLRDQAARLAEMAASEAAGAG